MTLNSDLIEPTTDYDNGQQPTKPGAAYTTTWQLPEAVKPAGIIGEYGYRWSSSEISPTVAGYWRMIHDYSGVFSNYYTKQSGLYVRCLRD